MPAYGPSSGSHCPGQDPLEPHSSSLPFLPTLVTALALGGLALLCRQPAAPEVPPATEPSIATRMLESTDAASEPVAVAASSGVAAFGRQYPLSVASMAGMTQTKAPRLATASRRRCGASPCEPIRAAAPTRAPDPATTAALPPAGQAEERENPLPFDALPFAPTTEAMLHTMRDVGSRAVSLGGSVAGSLTILQ